jgi:hypothetical protein
MIRYSHAITCLMAYYNKKRTEAICIVLQATRNHKTEEFVHPVRCIEKGRGCTEPQLIQ